MPIRNFEGPLDPHALKAVPEQYLIFYSSIVNGISWCPDCRDVELIVNQTFGPEDSPSALIVRVGKREEWKAPAKNVLRGEPFHLQGIPTIIRLKDGVEEARLVESEIAGGLAGLVKAGKA